MPHLAVTAEQARRFLVLRHLLAPPRSLPPTPASVLAVVERLGSLQFDPLDGPGARNHDLVLHARIGGYVRRLCDGLMYGKPTDRVLFEAYNKSLNILPTSELPFFRQTWDRAAARHADGILRERKATVSAVLDKLTSHGPLPTSLLGKAEKIDWHWAPTSEHRAVLEALFEVGRVGIERRDGNRRHFDLIERLLPAELLAQKTSPARATRHRLLSRYRAVGLLGTGGAPEVFIGTDAAESRALHLRALVRSGTLLALEVEGLKGPRFALADEAHLLEQARRPLDPLAGGAEVSFLGPLDPLLWDRRLLRDLFGFDYLWEVYTPQDKRRFGYYVLPVLFGDRLVGRVEPRLERASGELHLLGIWLEPGLSLAAEPGFAPAFARALAAYARLVGASKVRWPRSRSAAVRALRAASAD